MLPCCAMSLGPGGVYDAECQELAVRLQAESTLLVVIRGHKGSGFSMTMHTGEPLRRLTRTAEVLEEVARQIRADLAKLKAVP